MRKRLIVFILGACLFTSLNSFQFNDLPNAVRAAIDWYDSNVTSGILPDWSTAEIRTNGNVQIIYLKPVQRQRFFKWYPRGTAIDTTQFNGANRIAIVKAADGSYGAISVQFFADTTYVKENSLVGLEHLNLDHGLLKSLRYSGSMYLRDLLHAEKHCGLLYVNGDIAGTVQEQTESLSHQLTERFCIAVDLSYQSGQMIGGIPTII